MRICTPHLPPHLYITINTPTYPNIPLCTPVYPHIPLYTPTYPYIHTPTTPLFSQVAEKGVSVFLLPKGFLGTLHGLWDVLPLLSNSWVGEAAQIAFLERKMGAKFVERTYVFYSAHLTPLPPFDTIVMFQIDKSVKTACSKGLLKKRVSP